MYCPYCGTPCADTHKFCFRCGKPLPELTAQEPVPEENLPQQTVVEETVPAAAAPEETAAELPEVEEAVSEPAAEAPAEAAVPYLESEAPGEPTPHPKKGRLWPPVLALCLMICAGLAAFFLSGGSAAGERSCFTIESGVLYFDYSLYTGPDELTVPDTVDGMVVTAISDGCFENCDRLTTIILPETVAIIGDNAFAGCDALRGIYIPNGVLSIGAGALSHCPALEAIVFPASIAEIGEGCLDDCGSLQYILYDGTYAQWRELYDGSYRTGVELHTNDGVYYAQP